ncbi:MAG: hypothetical protein KAJ10_03955 [Thermodesulfovibrionia bacterium]|nr:hypothetical protein [Thermodesulfovibrionia bacterium]
MKKTLIVLICMIVFIMSLFLVSCQKQETVTEPEKAEETGGYGEEEPAKGEEEPAEAEGHGEEKPAETGGYGE